MKKTWLAFSLALALSASPAMADDLETMIRLEYSEYS